jgi:hypothetical protein
MRLVVEACSGEGLVAGEELIGDRLAAIQYQVPPHVAEVEPGRSPRGLRPVHDSGESTSGPKGVLGMEVAVDHRRGGGRGHRADGCGCLLPDAYVGQPARWRRLSPVVVEPVRRELSAERAARVVNHGQGLGKIRTESIGRPVCSCRGIPVWLSLPE